MRELLVVFMFSLFISIFLNRFSLIILHARMYMHIGILCLRMAYMYIHIWALEVL